MARGAEHRHRPSAARAIANRNHAGHALGPSFPIRRVALLLQPPALRRRVADKLNNCRHEIFQSVISVLIVIKCHKSLFMRRARDGTPAKAAKHTKQKIVFDEKWPAILLSPIQLRLGGGRNDDSEIMEQEPAIHD